MYRKRSYVLLLCWEFMSVCRLQSMVAILIQSFAWTLVVFILVRVIFFLILVYRAFVLSSTLISSFRCCMTSRKSYAYLVRNMGQIYLLTSPTVASSLSFGHFGMRMLWQFISYWVVPIQWIAHAIHSFPKWNWLVQCMCTWGKNTLLPFAPLSTNVIWR